MKRNRSQNISWFNPPFSRNVTTNIAKRFLDLLDLQFPISNKIHKIFNRNSAKVSYCCTENTSSIIKVHNKNLFDEKITPKDQFSSRNKNFCLLDGNCQESDVVYKCIASTINNADKVYQGTATGNFKKRCYYHKTFFSNRKTENNTTRSKYIWEVMWKSKEMLPLKW